MFGKAQFAKSRKKKPFTSLILTWLSIMYEVCFLDTPSVLIGLRQKTFVASLIQTCTIFMKGKMKSNTDYSYSIEHVTS